MINTLLTFIFYSVLLFPTLFILSSQDVQSRTVTIQKKNICGKIIGTADIPRCRQASWHAGQSFSNRDSKKVPLKCQPDNFQFSQITASFSSTVTLESNGSYYSGQLYLGPKSKLIVTNVTRNRHKVTQNRIQALFSFL